MTHSALQKTRIFHHKKFRNSVTSANHTPPPSCKAHHSLKPSSLVAARESGAQSPRYKVYQTLEKLRGAREVCIYREDSFTPALLPWKRQQQRWSIVRGKRAGLSLSLSGPFIRPPVHGCTHSRNALVHSGAPLFYIAIYTHTHRHGSASRARVKVRPVARRRIRETRVCATLAVCIYI